jgi:hypothetical protein
MTTSRPSAAAARSLRRFLLDLDAKDANDLDARTIGQVLVLYLAVNAHPRNEGGLAPSTYERYESIVGRHMQGEPRPRGGSRLAPATAWGTALASVAAVRFNGPQAPSAWREQMLREGVPKPARGQAWRVLSAALSWAAASQLVPEIEINGCRLATEPRGNKRRSLRAGGTGYAHAGAAAERSCPAGRSHRKPSRRSAPRCSSGPPAAIRSSRSATRSS